MNVLSEITIAMETQRATTMMVHLVAHAILASQEMEPIAKVCSIDVCQLLRLWKNIFQKSQTSEWLHLLIKIEEFCLVKK